MFGRLGGFHGTMGRVGSIPSGCEETKPNMRARQQWREAALVHEPIARIAHKVPECRACWHYFEGRSKAQLSRLVGTRDGPASGTDAPRSLPAGVGRGMQAAFGRGELAGLARAGAFIDWWGLLRRDMLRVPCRPGAPFWPVSGVVWTRAERKCRP